MEQVEFEMGLVAKILDELSTRLIQLEEENRRLTRRVSDLEAEIWNV